MTPPLQPPRVDLPDPRPYLLPEEKIRLVVRRNHPIVLAPVAVGAGIVAVAVLAWLLLATPPLSGVVFGLVIIVVALLWFGLRWLRWSRTVLVVTNRRLFQFVSLGIKRVTVLPIARQSIVFRQSPIGRAFGFGHVKVETATGSTLHDFPMLGNAAAFRDAVTEVAA